MKSMHRRRIAPILAFPFLAACGATMQNTTASVATDPTVAPNPANPAGARPAQGEPTIAAVTRSTPVTSAPAPVGALVFQIVPQQSTATFRVREQLAGRELPNDAVGTTGAVTGQLALLPNGSLAGEQSKISVDLRELKTDDSRRDNFIKRNTLQTDQYPLAEFVPTRAQGLPSPLPTSGEHSFQLTGIMTMHGQQKETTWDVKAKREGSRLTGTATTAVKFGDFGMTQPRVPLVLSIVDDIRLEIELVANLTG